MADKGGRRNGGKGTVGMVSADDASTRRMPSASVNSDTTRKEEAAPHLKPDQGRDA